MTRVKTARAKRIAGLNDRLRKEPANRSLGQVLMSRGVASRGAEFQAMVLAALAGMQPKDFKKATTLTENATSTLSRSMQNSAFSRSIILQREICVVLRTILLIQLRPSAF